jgi:menaquinone-dependent protoporphyrinogen IX oxidase
VEQTSRLAEFATNAAPKSTPNTGEFIEKLLAVQLWGARSTVLMGGAAANCKLLIPRGKP